MLQGKSQQCQDGCAIGVLSTPIRSSTSVRFWIWTPQHHLRRLTAVTCIGGMLLSVQTRLSLKQTLHFNTAARPDEGMSAGVDKCCCVEPSQHGMLSCSSTARSFAEAVGPHLWPSTCSLSNASGRNATMPSEPAPSAMSPSRHANLEMPKFYCTSSAS